MPGGDSSEGRTYVTGANLQIRPLTVADASACDAIIRGLPEHFGYPPGIADCAEAVRRERGLVAVDSGAVRGFLTLVSEYAESAEITWMAVQAELRGQGIGRRLIESLVDELRGDGVRLLAVKTASGHEVSGDDVYAATRAFYRACGFMPVMDLSIWETNLALLLVRPL